MRAAVFASPGSVEIQDVERSRDLLPDEVEVHVEACGICGTDLHILEDPPGHPANIGVVLGHEFVGRVTAVGASVISPQVGDRVVAEPNIGCGQCGPCKAGLSSQCENFTSLGVFRDGGLAERVLVPSRHVHNISADLPAAVAALAEPLACVVNGLQTARPMVGDSVVVIGGGAVGLLYAALYRKAGASKVTVVEPADNRRDVALLMGATEAVHPSDVTETLYGSFDIAVDAVGSQLPLALKLTAAGGQTLLFGLNSKVTGEIQQYEITRREISVRGVYVGSHTFSRAVRILETSGIDFTPMVSTYPLGEIGNAIAGLRAGKDVKTVIEL